MSKGGIMVTFGCGVRLCFMGQVQMQILGVVSDGLPGAGEGTFNRPLCMVVLLDCDFRNTAPKPGFLVPNLTVRIPRVISI